MEEVDSEVAGSVGIIWEPGETSQCRGKRQVRDIQQSTVPLWIPGTLAIEEPLISVSPETSIGSNGIVPGREISCWIPHTRETQAVRAWGHLSAQVPSLHSAWGPNSSCISTSLEPHWHLPMSTQRAAAVQYQLDPRECSRVPSTVTHTVYYIPRNGKWSTERRLPPGQSEQKYAKPQSCLPGAAITDSNSALTSSRSTVHLHIAEIRLPPTHSVAIIAATTKAHCLEGWVLPFPDQKHHWRAWG